MAQEKKVPIGEGEKATAIPAPANSLSSVLQRGSLASVEASAPEFHRRTLQAMGVQGSDYEAVIQNGKLIVPKPQVSTKREFERGDVVIDTVKRKRVVVLQCAAGVTKRGTICHRVIEEETGDMWLQRETKLKHKE